MPQQPDITLKCQSRVFLSNKEDMSPKYSLEIASKYNTRVHLVNFANAIATSESINKWVKNATDGKITSLTKPGNRSRQVCVVKFARETLHVFYKSTLFAEDFKDASNTKLFLANSVYFKGEWEVKFNKKQSQPDCFKLESLGCLETIFMRQRLNLKYGAFKELGAQIVEIPFKVGSSKFGCTISMRNKVSFVFFWFLLLQNPSYSMVLVIPSRPDGLKEVLEKLQQEPLLHLLENMKKLPLILSMPRMTIDFSSSLREILKTVSTSLRISEVESEVVIIYLFVLFFSYTLKTFSTKMLTLPEY